MSIRKYELGRISKARQRSARIKTSRMAYLLVEFAGAAERLQNYGDHYSALTSLSIEVSRHADKPEFFSARANITAMVAGKPHPVSSFDDALARDADTPDEAVTRAIERWVEAQEQKNSEIANDIIDMLHEDNEDAVSDIETGGNA